MQSIDHIMEQAARRCEAADLYYCSAESRSVSFDSNRLKRVTSRQNAGVGLRVVAGGRIGFASTTDLRRPERLVDMALESAAFGEKAVFSLPAPCADRPAVRTFDPAVGEVSMERMVEMGREALAMSRECNDAYLFSAGISACVGVERVVNTEGLDVQAESSEMSAGVSVQLVDDNGILEVYEDTAWGRPLDGVTDLAGRVLDRMRLGARTARLRSEPMPVMFSPKAVGNLLGPVMTALDGKLVQKGASMLRGRIGERVFDERLTVVDDPTLDWAPGSAPFDGEGLTARRLPLIERGVVRHYLLDLQTAALLGMEPTGNGCRSYASRPSPGSSNCVVAPGDTSDEEMVRAMRRGLLVDQTLGSGQSNTLAGEFSVNVELGFLVDNGCIVGRVKDCMVAGNAFDALAGMYALGAEARWEGSGHVPSIAVDGLRPAVDG